MPNRAHIAFLFFLLLLGTASCEPEGGDPPGEPIGRAEGALECREFDIQMSAPSPGASEFGLDEEFSPPLRFVLPQRFSAPGLTRSLGDQDQVVWLRITAGGLARICEYWPDGAEGFGPPVCDFDAAATEVLSATHLTVAWKGDTPREDPSIQASATIVESSPCAPDCSAADDGIACTLDFCDEAGVVTHSECLQLTQTTTTTVLDELGFLTEGPNPIQTAASGYIDPVRAAGIVGYARSELGHPLINAEVHVVGDDDLGTAHTDINGRFVMVVNGGGSVTVEVAAEGHFSSQRTVDVEWQTFQDIGSVELVRPDTRSTLIEMGPGTGVQVAESNLVQDDDGSRRAVLMFAPGTEADLELPTGQSQIAEELTFRLTEYTVGPTGEERMPGSLPPQTAYTYALEISADEALNEGATGIALSAPASLFVDNFLGVPVGTAVPSGSYERQSGVWIPNENGVVIEITDVSTGLADIDLTGDGVPEGEVALDAAGISTDERGELAARYEAGAELTHARLSHFSPVDLNFTWFADACYPLMCAADDPEFAPSVAYDEGSCLQEGSIIECTNQALGEAVPAVGTGHSLHYQSNRTFSGAPARRVEMPISGTQPLPSALLSIEARLHVAGRIYEQVTPCLGSCPTQASATFEWDGLDVFGRKLIGAQKATVELTYVFASEYTLPAVAVSIARAFGAVGSDTSRRLDARGAGRFTRRLSVTLNGWENESQALGGWSLDSVHSYDVVSGTLYRGDGSQRSADPLSTISLLRETGLQPGVVVDDHAGRRNSHRVSRSKHRQNTVRRS